MIEKKGKTWAAHASWMDAAGKRHRKYKSGFALKRDAEAWEAEYIRTHSDLAADADEITVGEFLDKYLASRKPSISPNTYSGYLVCVNRLKRFCGRKQLHTMKRLDYELVFQSMAHDSTLTKTGKPGKKPISRNTLHYC